MFSCCYYYRCCCCFTHSIRYQIGFGKTTSLKTTPTETILTITAINSAVVVDDEAVIVVLKFVDVVLSIQSDAILDLEAFLSLQKHTVVVSCWCYFYRCGFVVATFIVVAVVVLLIQSDARLDL